MRWIIMRKLHTKSPKQLRDQILIITFVFLVILFTYGDIVASVKNSHDSIATSVRENQFGKVMIYLDELKTEVKNLNQTNKTLEKEKNNLDTDESKERIARERLGMIKEGEISLQEAQEGEAASTTAADSAETTTASEDQSGQTTESADQTTQSQTENKATTQKTD